MQYADDTLLFLEKDSRVALNLKWILTCFEQVSGMRINYHKSALVPINVAPQELDEFVDIFQCVVGSFPIKYLGIPLHYDKLSREDLQYLIDKILARIAGWRGKLLSYLGRIILIKTCLASIPIYLLSFFKFPKWDLNLINSHMANCLWSDTDGAHKIHLVNWPSICMKKRVWGYGVPNLQDMNLCLIGSWVKRYIAGEGSLWRRIVDNKYNTKSPNILCCRDPHPSQFWKGVMWALQAVKVGYKWQVGDVD